MDDRAEIFGFERRGLRQPLARKLNCDLQRRGLWIRRRKGRRDRGLVIYNLRRGMELRIS